MKQILQTIKNRLFKKRTAEPVLPQTEEAEAPKPKKKPSIFARVFPKVMMVIFAGTFILAGVQLLKNNKQANERDSLYTELADVAVTPVVPKPNSSISGNSNNQNPDGSQQDDLSEELLSPDGYSLNYSPIAVDFDYLQKKNPDIMAWIYCPGTPISYPVVRGTDNEYYLNRLIDGTVNKSGSIFADCRNRVDFTDPHTIIYGHNMKDMSMFGSVGKYSSQEYYDAHPVWYINTPEKNYAVHILAGHTTAPNAELYAFKGTLEEPQEILRYALSKSAFQSKTAAVPGEPLVTFSTCHGNSRRFVLLGVLREIG